jgi:FkbM family methyltransferase
MSDLIEFNGLWLPASEREQLPYLEAALRETGQPAYQKATIDAAMKHVPADRRRRFIDVGAHVGHWSRFLADAFQQVEAFEPIPLLADCFLKNVPQENVNLYRCALGKKAGTVSLAYRPDQTGGTHVVGPGGTDESEQVFEAPLRALDEFGFTEVDLIKLDVEGYERFVLSGALDTLAISRPIVVCEVKPHKNHQNISPKAALEYMDMLGMVPLGRIVDDFIMGWPT